MSTSKESASELEALRKVAIAAESCFEHEGAARRDAESILAEALRSAREDFNNLMDANSGSPTRLDGAAFMRAASRCDLALALAEYRARYGAVQEEQSPQGVRFRSDAGVTS